MKKLLLASLVFISLIIPATTHAATFTQKVIIPTTKPTADKSTVNGFQGCKQWGEYGYGNTTIFQCTETGGTVRNCSVVESIGGESGPVLDGVCEEVQNGKIITQGNLVDTGLGAQSKVTDNSGKTTTTGGVGDTSAKIDASKSGAPVDSTNKECGLNPFCYLGEGLAQILQGIAFAFMVLVAWILGIVGVLFNWIVVITVFQFATYFGNSQGMLLAWGILRDVGNILLLFGFLYAGVMMLLDLHSFDARKAIPRLIIFAVLLNFSLFAGEAVVDISNVLSTKLYQQAGQSVIQKCSGTSCTNQVGIAEVLIQDTGLGSAFSLSKDSALSQVVTNPDHMKMFMAYVAIIIMMSIVTILLLAAAIMFLLRAITLVVLLVTSPIGFVGFAIPALEGQAKKWWETLIANAFFAPIFLLLLFVGLKVMEGVRGGISLGNDPQTLIGALADPNTGIGSVLIVFALIIGFFMAALMFAKNSGAAGAQFATNFAQKTVTTGVGGIGRWSYGFTARNTVGRAGRYTARKYNETLGDLKTKPGFVGGLAKGFDYMAGDAITGAAGGLAKKRFGDIRSLEENESHQKHRDHETGHAAHERHNKIHLNDALALPGETPENIRDRDVAIKDALAAMTQSEKETNENFKKIGKNLSLLVRNMSTKDYDAYIANEKIDHETREEAKKLRFSVENAAYVLKNMTPESIAGLSGSILKKDYILQALRGRDLAAIDPAKHSDETINAIKIYIDTHDTQATRTFKALVGTDGGEPGISTNPNAKNRWSEFYRAAGARV